jgi:hypothetical protein
MPIDLVGIPKVFDGDESGKSELVSKCLAVTYASNSYSGDASPTTAQHGRQGADATAKPARQNADQCLWRDLPATNRICHLEHNWRLQV